MCYRCTAKPRIDLVQRCHRQWLCAPCSTLQRISEGDFQRRAHLWTGWGRWDLLYLQVGNRRLHCDSFLNLLQDLEFPQPVPSFWRPVYDDLPIGQDPPPNCVAPPAPDWEKTATAAATNSRPATSHRIGQLNRTLTESELHQMAARHKITWKCMKMKMLDKIRTQKIYFPVSRMTFLSKIRGCPASQTDAAAFLS